MTSRVVKYRIPKEIAALKAKYPVVIQGGTNGNLLMIVIESISDKRRGKPIVITIHLDQGFPSKPPPMEILGYQVSENSDKASVYNPGEYLVTYVSKLIADVQAAENLENFMKPGGYFIGTNFTIYHPVNDTAIDACVVCSKVTDVACSCCNTPVCSVHCQEEMHK